MDNSGSSVETNQGSSIGSKGIGSLEQNIPNPFANTTTINYTLETVVREAKITVMDINGKVRLEKRIQPSGSGNVTIDLSDLTGGIYFYSLVADGSIVATKPMVKR